MTSKLVVNTIESDTGISSVSFASSISMNSTAKFHFSAAGVDIGADTNINRPASGVLGFESNGTEKVRIDGNGLRVNTAVDNGSGFSAQFHNTGTSNRIQLTTANTGTGLADGAIIMIDSGSNMEILNRENTSLEFFTNNTQRLTLDNNGALRNVNGARSDFYNGSYDARGLHVEGVGSDRRGWISLVTNHSTSGESVLMFGKTRGTSSNARTIVAANDDLGVMHFSGADGVDLRRAAEVRAQVDGTPAVNKVGGRLMFYTTANTTDANPTERLRIGSSGQIGLGGANYGSSGQVLTSQGSGSAVQWASPVVLAMGYSSDASDSNTIVNNTTLYAGSTLAMTRVSATSKYILRIGAQIYRPSTSSRGYLKYQVKVNSGSYNTAPGDSSRYSWYMGDETSENYREVTLTYLSSGSVGDTVTFQVGYQNTASQDDRFRWQIIQATEVSALTV